MRVDFNVPMTKGGKVADANRILQTIPTLQYILEKGIDGCGPDMEIYVFFFLLPDVSICNNFLVALIYTKFIGPKCVILMSHMGRPDGKRVKKFSLEPLVTTVETLLGHSINFLPDCVGTDVEAACAAAMNGMNIRKPTFHYENTYMRLNKQTRVLILLRCLYSKWPFEVIQIDFECL